MLGGMEDEVFDPSGGISVVNWLDVLWGGSEKEILLDVNGGFFGIGKWVVEASVDDTLGVSWDVVCTKGWVRMGWVFHEMGVGT